MKRTMFATSLGVLKPLLALAGLILNGAFTFAGDLPSSIVPSGLSTNIRYNASARDLDMLQAAGFKFVRTDLGWSFVEKEKGKYDFGPYDRLTDGLEKRGIRPLYILDYENRLYEKERSVRTEAGRQAFANFAAAAAARYKGRGVIWELWNEPNLGFWKPRPDATEYMKLAEAALAAIRKADPGSTCIAPAAYGFPTDFFNECFKQGLLNMVDAISVHPYRRTNPETVIPDILRLRALIAQYSPNHPSIPVISSEWGYSTYPTLGPEVQGEYLAREFLTNLSLGLPLSNWYDWHDDGTDPKNSEHNFGTVTYDYQLKPAYLEMQRLVAALGGQEFVKRLESGPEDWLLLFSDGKRSTIAAWTTGPAKSTELFPGHELQLTGDPRYLPVPADAVSLRAQGAWTVKADTVAVRAGADSTGVLRPQFEVYVHNPTERQVHVQFDVSYPKGVAGGFSTDTQFELAPGAAKTLTWSGTVPQSASGLSTLVITGTIDGLSSHQSITFAITNPVSLSVYPADGGRLLAVVHNPSGDIFQGVLELTVGGFRGTYSVDFDPGEHRINVKGAGVAAEIQGTDALVFLPGLPFGAGQDVRVVLREADAAIADSGVLGFVPLRITAETVKAFNDGDPKVSARFALTNADLHSPGVPFTKALRFTYEYGAGWKFVRIAPPRNQPVEGKPKALGVWVRGDNTNCSLRLRFADSGGRTFQAEFGSLNYSGWRYLTVPMDDPHISHWGGRAGDEITYPITINTYVLVDGLKAAVSGTVDFAGFGLIYSK